MSLPLKYADTVMLPPTDDYHPWELRWLNKPDTIPRYMRASKWNLRDAETRIKATLEWRREYKPDLIPPDEVKIESETGKMYVQYLSLRSRSLIQLHRIISGFDNDGRPIIYMRPGRENTQSSSRQLRYLVWCLYVFINTVNYI